MVDRNHILVEIKRTAQENGGVPLGVKRFYTETGIKETDWIGKYWARWGDALKEAGFSPNELRSAYDDDVLLRKLALLARELGHFPARTEIQLQRRTDASFPDKNTFRRLGSKATLAEKLASYCRNQGGFEDVLEMCSRVPSPKSHENEETRKLEEFGYVYLLRSGRYYKIGRSNAVGRRERELAIQLPEKGVVVHSIKTDDPNGIEEYWHRRFEARHKNGEWYELSSMDVAAFRRRKFM